MSREPIDDAITERCLDRVAARGGLVPLSHRIRADCEAAPWVINEVRKLEAELTAARATVDALIAALRIAVRQNSHDMLMTGEELRLCELALANVGGAK